MIERDKWRGTISGRSILSISHKSATQMSYDEIIRHYIELNKEIEQREKEEKERLSASTAIQLY